MPGVPTFFQSAFNALVDHIAVLDERGMIVFVNEAWRRFADENGYTGTDAGMGLNYLKVCERSRETCSYADLVLTGLRKVLNEGRREFELEYPCHAPKGQKRWFNLRATRFVDSNEGFVVVSHENITKRKLADLALGDSEHRLQLALDASKMGTFVWHVAEDRAEADARMLALFGLAADDRLSLAEALATIINPDDSARYAQAVARAVDPAGTGELREDIRVRQADGSMRWLAITGQTAFEDEPRRAVRMPGMAADITERKRAEEHQKVLLNELNHRVKNTLAIVQSLAAQTFRGTQVSAEARDLFGSRLAALARAHDVLTRHNWESAGLGEIVGRAMESFQTGAVRIAIVGPEVRVSPKQALALSMALHELATNAAKYGALSGDAGRVRISWQFTRNKKSDELELTWTEAGGPPVRPPDRKGFGARLIERNLASELEGQVNIDYRPEGVICVIRCPLVMPERHFRFRSKSIN